MIDVKGRWALITGAARGIGYGAALFMAKQGCNLVLHGRTAAHCDKVLSEVKALGVELKPYYVSSQLLADMSDYDFTGSLIGDKANSVIFDNSKVKKLVPDFKATVSAEEGIKMTVRYVLEHPEYQNDDPEFDSWCDKVIETLENMKKTFNK